MAISNKLLDTVLKIIKMNTLISQVSEELKEVSKEVREIDKRVVRLETIVELAQKKGTVQAKMLIED